MPTTTDITFSLTLLQGFVTHSRASASRQAGLDDEGLDANADVNSYCILCSCEVIVLLLRRDLCAAEMRSFGCRYPAVNDDEARAWNFGRCRVLVRNLG
jgi:hypothetical protein